MVAVGMVMGARWHGRLGITTPTLRGCWTSSLAVAAMVRPTEVRLQRVAAEEGQVAGRLRQGWSSMPPPWMDHDVLESEKQQDRWALG
jgi:hypothetical protein